MRELTGYKSRPRTRIRSLFLRTIYCILSRQCKYGEVRRMSYETLLIQNAMGEKVAKYK